MPAFAGMTSLLQINLVYNKKEKMDESKYYV
jgi:hypothetical protein